MKKCYKKALNSVKKPATNTNFLANQGFGLALLAHAKGKAEKKETPTTPTSEKELPEEADNSSKGTRNDRSHSDNKIPSGSQSEEEKQEEEEA